MKHVRNLKKMMLPCAVSCLLAAASATYADESSEEEALPEGQWQGTLQMDAGESINLTLEIKNVRNYRLVTISIPGKAVVPVTNFKTENGVLTFVFTLDYKGMQCALETGDGDSLEGDCRDASLKEHRMSISRLAPEET